MWGSPETIGRYQIRERLGAGGFATVYRAYDPTLDREIALKVLHSYRVADATVRERFVREGRALARVRHPNVIVVYEAGEIDGIAYLATELIEGRTLDAIAAARGPLPLADVLTAVDQVAAALAAVHARGLVHRDVKPANIMVEREGGRAVLLDLGVARDLAGATSGSVIMGTPSFMAPEQVQHGGRVSARTDVYQLGATVYCLLGGRPPFAGDTLQVLDAIKLQPPPDLHELRPDLPLAVVAVIAEAMAKDPARRPAGPREFIDELRRAAGVASPLPSIPLVASAASPDGDATMTHAGSRRAANAPTAARRRWLTLVAGAAAALVVVAVLAGLALMRLNGGDAGDHAATDSEDAAATPAALAVAPVRTCPPGDATTLAPGCASVTASVAKPGERARLTFDGVKGRRLSLGMTQVKFGDALADVSVTAPGGKALGTAAVGKDGRDLDLSSLPETGAYTVEVAPRDRATGNVLLTLSESVAGRLSVDGPPLALTIDRPGQNARLTFQGEAGKIMSLAFTRVEFGRCDICAVRVSVVAPDTPTAAGKTLMSGTVGTNGRDLDLPPLPSTGTYVVLLNPELLSVSLTALLSSEITASVVPGGPPFAVTVERPGQNARVTFEGMQGQRLSVALLRVRFGDCGGCGLRVNVTGPDDISLVTGSFGTDGRDFDLKPLPARGRYAIVINPELLTGNLLVGVSPEITGALTVGSPPATVTIDRPGQNARLTFEGIAGQRLVLMFARVRVGDCGGCGVRVTVLTPDGETLSSSSFGTDGREIALPVLPVAGAYAVVINPELLTGSLMAALRAAP